MEQLKTTSVAAKQAAFEQYLSNNADTSQFAAVVDSLVVYLRTTEEGQAAVLTAAALANIDAKAAVAAAFMHGYKLRLAEEQLEGVKPGDCTCVEHKRLNCEECAKPGSKKA